MAPDVACSAALSVEFLKGPEKPYRRYHAT
jgi:hypothetical protein